MDAYTPASMMAAIPQEPPKPVTHDVTIVTTRKSAKARVMGVPPEEFGIERGARDIPSANYAFHDVVTKTKGELIAEGYDEEQVVALQGFDGKTDIETLARDSVNEHFSAGNEQNRSSQLVRLTEHYIRMDYEGNGKPCLYMVVTGQTGGQVLLKDGKPSIYPIDVIPFATTTPIPIPHRFWGRSLADIVMPKQREKTALKRAALDNMYLHNAPRPEISESHVSESTIDDLLVHRSGAPIRTKMPGGLNWQVVPDITASIYPFMQYVDAEIESGTGVSKQTQGIDANALQNQSATAVAQVFSSSQMRMKLIARNFAEGMRDIFSLLHHTIRSHGQEQQTVRLRNAWVPVDPRNWKTRADMTINVGLGTGGKAQQFAQVMALGNFQKELLLGGKANLVDDQALFNTAAQVTKIMGYKNPDQFFNDPSAKDPKTGQPLHPPLPPQPSPEAIKAQGQMQIEQTKAQANMQIEQGKAQLEQQKAQTEAQQAADKAQLDAFHQKVKLEGELQLAREKAQMEKELALIDAAIKERADQRAHELHQQKMMHAQQLHEHTLAQTAQAHETKMVQTAQGHDASIKQAKVEHQIKTGGVLPEDITPKVHEAIKPLADHLAKSQEAQSAALLAAVKEMARPKRIVRDPKTGKASHTESI